MFPRDLVSIGDSINSAFVEFGYLTNNNAVSIPGFCSTLKYNQILHFACGYFYANKM